MQVDYWIKINKNQKISWIVEEQRTCEGWSLKETSDKAQRPLKWIRTN